MKISKEVGGGRCEGRVGPTDPTVIGNLSPGFHCGEVPPRFQVLIETRQTVSRKIRCHDSRLIADPLYSAENGGAAMPMLVQLISIRKRSTLLRSFASCWIKTFPRKYPVKTTSHSASSIVIKFRSDAFRFKLRASRLTFECRGSEMN